MAGINGAVNPCRSVRAPRFDGVNPCDLLCCNDTQDQARTERKSSKVTYHRATTLFDISLANDESIRQFLWLAISPLSGLILGSALDLELRISSQQISQ